MADSKLRDLSTDFAVKVIKMYYGIKGLEQHHFERSEKHHIAAGRSNDQKHFNKV